MPTGWRMFFRRWAPIFVKVRLDGAVDLIEDGLRDADPAGFGDLLQTRRDVDRVAADSAALYDDVSGIDADAVIDLVLDGAMAVASPGPRFEFAMPIAAPRRCWNIRPAARPRQTGGCGRHAFRSGA